jgi:transposase-like protein
VPGATLTVKILADIADFEKGMTKSERVFLKSVDRIGDAGKKLALTVTAPLLALGGAIAKAAAEDEASVAKLNRTFGTNAKAMETWINQLMKTVPATDDELRGLAVSTDTLLRSMGLAAPAAATLTQNVTKLAGDLAAYNKVELNVAQDALERALAGKTKGLQEFGIVISEADIKARAYQMGIARVGHELTHAQEAQAAWSLILQKSALQQGEAARTIGENENALKRLRQAADGVADSFGALVLPAFAKATGAVASFLNKLTDTPPAFKNTVVAMGTVVAAAPLVLTAFASMTRNATLLNAALIKLNGTGGLAGIGKLMLALAPIAALVGGPILAVMHAFDKEGEAARNAAAALGLYKEKLEDVNAAQLKAAATEQKKMLAALTAQRSGIQSQISALPKPGPDYDVVKTPQAANALSSQLAKVDAQIAALQPLFDATTAKLAAMNQTAAGGGGSGAPSLADQLKDIKDNADIVLTSIKQMDEGWSRIPGVGALWITTLREATALIDKIPDKLDPTVVKAREIALALRAAFNADEILRTSNIPTVQVTPSKSYLNTPLGGGPSVAPLAAIPPGLTRVEQAMRAGFAQVSVAIGDTLATNLSTLMGGKGIGAQIGGGIGGAFGGAAAASAFQFAGTGILAAAGNAVVPVIGGLIGTALGGLVGGLFGGHKKKVDESARSLDTLAKTTQRVNEALSNLPQGFKIARARYMAATPYDPNNPGPVVPGTPPGTGPEGTGRGGASGNIIVQGNLVLNGVADVRGIVEKAQRSLNRGGGGFTLAASRA